MCATIIGTPAFNTLYNLPLPIIQQSLPVTSNTVVEYRERNLRPFLFTESRSSRILGPLFALSSAQPTGLGQGTEMAMVEA